MNKSNSSNNDNISDQSSNYSDDESLNDESSDSDIEIKDETMEMMKKNYSYPSVDDPNIQYALFKKREFNYNRIHEKPEMKDYADIKEYRDNTCDRTFALHEHQVMLSNLINPDTPYKGILVFHGLGSGKCVHKSTRVFLNGKYEEIEKIWENNITDIVEDDEGGLWSKPQNNLTVNSYDEKTGKIIQKSVLNLYREKINSHLREITFDDGTKITITDVHKLLTINGWTNNLSINDYAMNENTQYLKIVNIILIGCNDYVYDLEVEDTHNYVANGIICHNTCVGVAIAEKFKQMVQKYNTKIYILVPGPIIKDSWKHHLLSCTGETYKKYQNKYVYMDKTEKARQDKQALAQALQYYKIMSYRSFYRRVLGEKIKESSKGIKNKTIYRKTEEGEFERDIAVDRIYNLNNTIIIVDEAHNLTGNAYGKALEKIIHNSLNLKVILMTATPMKNLGDDIVELINFLRPKDSPMERDKMFNSYKNHAMDFKTGGLEYFKNMINGYVSHVRGSDPLTFATRVDRGTIPPGLLFTNCVRCEMLEFQRITYDGTIKEVDDALDRKSEAVANFAFPGLSKDRKEIVGYYGREGLNIIKDQLKVSGELLNKKIGQKFFGGKEDTDLIYMTQEAKLITGKILKIPYLKHFSIKFYKTLKKLNRLVAGKKGPKTAFVYSNLVKVGIEIFQEILVQNGYLEYQEDSSNYQLSDDTICYYCGKTYGHHLKMSRHNLTIKEMMAHEPDHRQTGGDMDTDAIDATESDAFSEDSNSSDLDVDIDEDYIDPNLPVGLDVETEEDESDESYDGSQISQQDLIDNQIQKFSKSVFEIPLASETSTEYSEKQKKHYGIIPSHKFYPATFISITGKSSEESSEAIPEEKKKILDDVFNSSDNKEGKFIKFILGSRVMNEGISMKSVGEVHVLDVYFNLGRVDQVVGRAIRWCSHKKVANENNIFPYVSVYKYVVTLSTDKQLDTPENLSSEEDLYRKAEQKYILIKKIERAMKERSFDCPLNMHGNIFNEEIKKFEGCQIHGTGDPNSKTIKCPAICDYQKCHFKCDDPKLNHEYYDPNRKIYKAIPKNDLDVSTFKHNLAKSEIEYAKLKIKEMYIVTPIYTLKDIIDYVKDSYDSEKKDLFDEFYVYKALDDLIPITENDFNNFKDTIIDKNNVQGYLIYRDKYYIFQPFNQNEDVPLNYRVNNMQDIRHELSLYNYLKHSDKYKKLRDDKKKNKDKDKMVPDEEINAYNFDDTMDYYEARPENKYVGIIDKEISRRKSKRADEIKDVFKIREKLPKTSDKKRGTGIPSLKGAVCSTSKSKQYLKDIAKSVDSDFVKGMTRTDICINIEKQMLLKEKYATEKDGNLMTYVRIPANHPLYPFPYNLEDRVKYIINKIKSEIKVKLDVKTKTITKDSGEEKGHPSYVITVKKTSDHDEYSDFMKKTGFQIDGDNWVTTVQ